ncbi:SDR family oxidoreductase [Algiphilus sp. W345]|uniref:SDR family oxidoreductase n=1 Tax=Banduia mediterranea TaxID=3075609 RepID=A0ABU2WEI4_9GAMM|nr:SDR family oxidoreductase [Algiphilus sp. W345]MDT0495955.1 SDR family oxidoreductase [Algiphilus sp. W345]
MTGRTALVTGASSGIGEEFARQLAADNYDLILVARSREKLLALAEHLRERHGCRIEVIAADLTQPRPGRRIADSVEALGMHVDLLINNAGFGHLGAFDAQEAGRPYDMVQLNCAAVVDLVEAFLPPMLAVGRGGIVNVASLAAFQPMPRMSVYSATKAFVLNFSLGLWAEYKKRGIRVVCVCPGPVDTPFFETSGAGTMREYVPRFAVASANRVVDDALLGLERARPVVLPRQSSKWLAAGSRLLPQTFIARFLDRALDR